MEDTFVRIQIPQQKVYDGIQFPSVVSPTSSSSLSRLTHSIHFHKQFLESLLLESGAVLLRGLPVNTASDFNEVVEAFGYEELPYLGGNAPRRNVVGRVYTANEAPPDQKIHFHHEMAQLPAFPSKLFFFCDVLPASGGETPIVPSHIVYEKMKERHPEFVEQLEKHGLIYIRVLGEEDNPSSPIGRGWKSTFLTQDKIVAEKRAARLGMKLEWLEDGGVKTIMGPIAGIKQDEARQRKIWFNSLVAAYTGWKDERNDPANAVTFGDGKPLPGDVVHDCLRILEDESVAVPWQKGDVLLIDNLAVLHSRNTYKPPRRVLASLAK
ncbi:clavaminate synthase-like protein At3g21360 [Neltuma alba]|uniref:clavaminate synthase-like protein At3g21360 n=1 Tax=Neltuma alba TaxID=207710 RepID=UPI0010A2EDEB|nr:clavaminate synthase-like protein At3g21360 [Prosopis alba]